MNIRTFIGSNSDMYEAVKEAECGAQTLLDNLNRDELISVKTESFVDRPVDGPHTCFHIITIVYI